MDKKIMYIDCGMGAAGDMLTAALTELLPDPEKFVQELNSLGIPGVQYVREEVSKCGIGGTHMSVRVNGEEEHEHSHEHEHKSIHSHRSMADIEKIITSLNIPQKVAADVMAVYGLIAEAESHVHKKTVEEVHFHEVGTMDAIADITAVCLLMDRLAPDRVIASPIHVGSGQVRCAHGILPVPAPATAYLLNDIPIYGGQIRGELCTPTGAALLKHFVDCFGDMPKIKVDSIGYGMGKKDFERANCVRILFGETISDGGADQDTVVELNCNVDDMTPEEIGFAMERLYAGGALEVFTTSVGMKKCRPGVLITVLCREDSREKIVEQLMKHTTTIGIRETLCKRYVLSRQNVTQATSLGDIQKKEVCGYGVIRSKYEYEDLAKIARARDMSLAEVRKMIETEAN